MAEGRVRQGLHDLSRCAPNQKRISSVPFRTFPYPGILSISALAAEIFLILKVTNEIVEYFDIKRLLYYVPGFIAVMGIDDIALVVKFLRAGLRSLAQYFRS